MRDGGSGDRTRVQDAYQYLHFDVAQRPVVLDPKRGTRHHADVVAEVRRIQSGDAGDDQDGLRRALVRRLDL